MGEAADRQQSRGQPKRARCRHGWSKTKQKEVEKEKDEKKMRKRQEDEKRRRWGEKEKKAVVGRAIYSHIPRGPEGLANDLPALQFVLWELEKRKPSLPLPRSDDTSQLAADISLPTKSPRHTD